LTERLISIIKFSIAVFILPILIGVTVSLSSHIADLPKNIGNYFLWGIISYLILHLFIGEPIAIYEKGQDMVGVIFKFFSPAVDVLSFCLPIYTIIVLIVYLLISLFSDISSYAGIFAVLISFSMAFHIINSAKFLSFRGDDFLKAHYFFSLELVYILNIFITATFLRCLSSDFSFLNFFNTSLRATKYIYFLLIKQLFI